MPIGTSDGEYYDDRLSHALSAFPKPRDADELAANEMSGDFQSRYTAVASQPLPQGIQKVYIAPKYETQLDPQQEMAFGAWKNKVAPNDSGEDYDFRGAYKAGITPDVESGHWPDTFKKPNHPTFSDQSQYAKDRPDMAGTWDGDTYIPPKPSTFFDRLSIVNAVKGMSAGAEDAVKNFPQHFKEGLQGMIDTIKGPGEASQNQLPMWAVNPETGEVNTSHQAIEKAANLAMVMVGGPAPVAEKMADGTLGSFMGVNSKTFNKAKAFEAHRMELEGATPDEIWVKTGTTRFGDRRMRQEINDRDAALKLGAFDTTLTPKGGVDSLSLKPNRKDFFGQTPNAARLPDVIEHPDLFNAYPFLKSTKVVPLAQDLADRGVEGMMDLEHNTLHLGRNLREDQAKSIILHEVAHAIQQKEGFIGGTDPHWFRPEGFEPVTKQLTEAEDWLKKQFKKKNLSDADYANMKGAVQAEDEFNIMAQSGVFEKGIEVHPLMLERLNDAKNLGVYRQLKNVVQGERHLKEADAKYFEHYMRAAGEVEARNVQARMRFNAYQRANTNPVYTEDRPRFLQQDEIGIPLTLRHKMQDSLKK